MGVKQVATSSPPWLFVVGAHNIVSAPQAVLRGGFVWADGELAGAKLLTWVNRAKHMLVEHFWKNSPKRSAFVDNSDGRFPSRGWVAQVASSILTQMSSAVAKSKTRRCGLVFPSAQDTGNSGKIKKTRRSLPEGRFVQHLTSYRDSTGRMNYDSHRANVFSKRLRCFLNFDIAFRQMKAQHLLALAEKVEQGGLNG
jgi:hypothetical protein